LKPKVLKCAYLAKVKKLKNKNTKWPNTHLINRLFKAKIFKVVNTERTEKIKKWIKKVGFWGFMFFLVKGLVWLAVGYFIVK
jgi:hypothetical protein